MNNALLIGVILIIAGIALAVFAYMVITSSDEDEQELDLAEQEKPEEFAEPVDEDLPDTDYDSSEVADDDGEQEHPDSEPALMDAPVDDEAHAKKLEQEQVEERDPEASEPDSIETPTPSKDRPRIEVATLLRDEVSGELIIQVGDREYSSAEELKSSPDWTRLEYAASDLSTWVSTPERPAPVSKENGEKIPERKPSSMIEQINSILQERIESSGRSELAVRLIEGPGGMARVLIGVHSYEIGEVPDPEVRELIRQAVASWESMQ